MPEIDEMLTIDPPPAAFMTGIANFMPRKTPRALTAINRSQAAVSKRSSTALPESPASLTRRSSLPNSASVVSTVAFHSASLVTSRWRKTAAPFAFVMSATTCLPSSSSTSATTTLAPSRAKMRAMLAPIPDAAPVISATLSSNLIDLPPSETQLEPSPLPRAGQHGAGLGWGLDDGDLPPQLAGKQALWDHRVDPAHDIDHLRHPKAHRDAT